MLMRPRFLPKLEAGTARPPELAPSPQLLPNPLGRPSPRAPRGRFMEGPLPRPLPKLLLPPIRFPSGPKDDIVLRRFPFNILMQEWPGSSSGNQNKKSVPLRIQIETLRCILKYDKIMERRSKLLLWLSMATTEKERDLKIVPTKFASASRPPQRMEIDGISNSFLPATLRSREFECISTGWNSTKCTGP